jgi:hypothetical protein
MKRLFVLAVPLFFARQAVAQQPADSLAKNSVFVEVGGNGGLISLNYERAVAGLQLRVGSGMWSDLNLDLFASSGKSYITFPIMLSRMLNSGTQHLELGGGMLFGRESVDSVVFSTQQTYSRSITSVQGFIGYRRQPLGGGFLLRLGMTPSYAISGDYPADGFHLGAGLSLGWAF